MKKLVLVAVMVLCVAGVAMADLGLSAKETGALKTGFAYGFKDGSTYNLSEVEVMSYKSTCLNIGMATDFNGENMETVSLSYKLGTLEKYGVEFPLSDFINPEIGGWYGRDFINTGDDPKPLEDYGIKLTVIKKTW